MNELKNVTNKLFKTELAAEKLELSMIDDFNKLSSTLFTQSNKFEQEVNKIQLAIKSMQNEFITLEKLLSQINNDYGRAKKTAIELGLNLPAEVENEYKKVLEVVRNDLANFKKYNAVTR